MISAVYTITKEVKATHQTDGRNSITINLDKYKPLMELLITGKNAKLWQ